jgi:hypothetical protein
VSNHIPTNCTQCSAPLHAHNLTGLCAECKLIARNARLGGPRQDDAEAVTLDQALANLAAIFEGSRVYEGEATR